MSSVVVVCIAAGGRAGRPPGAWERSVGTLPAAGSRARGRSARRRRGAWAVGRPTLHGGPVVLRPVRATPCLEFASNMTCFVCDADAAVTSSKEAAGGTPLHSGLAPDNDAITVEMRRFTKLTSPYLVTIID